MHVRIQNILKRLKQLSPERQAEVGDFVEFLHQREREQHLPRSGISATPLRLEPDVQNAQAALASAKGIDLSVFVNDFLKKNIEMIQMAH